MCRKSGETGRQTYCELRLKVEYIAHEAIKIISILLTALSCVSLSPLDSEFNASTSCQSEYPGGIAGILHNCNFPTCGVCFIVT